MNELNDGVVVFVGVATGIFLCLLFDIWLNKSARVKGTVKENKNADNPDLKYAKTNADKYSELGSCCDILSKIRRCDEPYAAIDTGGWRLYAYAIQDSGIDIDEVYKAIELLALKRKAELEAELLKLDNKS